MNAEEAKYRFDELITTIQLLPEITEETQEVMSEWVFPNLTRDLSEPEVYTAVLCQTFKGDTEFQLKMCTALQASAVTSINKQVENDNKPTQDDLYAMALTANILWGIGSDQLFGTLHMIQSVCDNFDLEMPDLATIMLRPNGKAVKFGRLDPYKIIAGEYTPEEVISQLTDKG